MALSQKYESKKGSGPKKSRIPNSLPPGTSEPVLDSELGMLTGNGIPSIVHPDGEDVEEDIEPQPVPSSDPRGSQPYSNESLGEEVELTVGKPQVIVRIRPSPNIEETPTFEVDQLAKTIQIRVDRPPKPQERLKPTPGFIYFPADSVLENCSQEATFTTVAQEVVEKAMMGIPGMIVAIGPEMSGKSFSLFGLSGRYRNRGIAARALEKMFEIKDRRAEQSLYKFGMGIIEVRRERIRDLLTLAPFEINDVGDKGPKGMYIEEVDCMEHGLGLLLRALIGQKLIHQEPYERYHTLVYVDIVAVSPLAPDLVQLRSRITFAEIASAPYRSNEYVPLVTPTVSTSPSTMTSPFYNPNCCGCAPPVKQDKFRSKQAVFPSRKCANPGYTTGPLAEGIAVRRDTFALEQIFLKANEMFRIRQYFSKLENLGLSMLASEKRRLASGHNFRQNKLAHCLKDILDQNTEIRIVLHVRPDKAYLKSSLEAMRFAERARLVPSNLDGDRGKGKPLRSEEQILQEVIMDIAPELLHPAHVESLNSEKMRAVQEQAVKYFEDNIGAMKVISKEKVKSMFENFRVLWNFLWELELNLTLRKAEDEMKKEMEKMGGLLVPVNDSRKGSGASLKKQRPSDAGRSDFGDGMDDSKPETTGKKSKAKVKKEKKKKKDKKGEEKLKEKRTSSNEIKTLKEARKKSGGGSDPAPLEVEEGPDARRGSLPVADAAVGGSETMITGEADVINTSPPETGVQGQPDTLAVVDSGTRRESGIGFADKNGLPEMESMAQEEEDEDAFPEDGMDGEEQSETGAGKLGRLSDIPKQPLEELQQGAAASGANQTIISSTTHIHHAAGLRHNSTFFVKGGFTDFKLHNVWGGEHVATEGKVLTEEERKELAAQQEQQISNNFEEMKKIARRQAIHLLRTGVRRPQWQVLF